MQQLVIKTSVSKEVEKKIILPSFWKQGNRYLAAIDEKTCISLFAFNGYINISHGTCKFYSQEISIADEKWDPTTEQEFLSAYDDAHEAIRMKPLLIDTGSDQAYTEFMKTQNF